MADFVGPIHEWRQYAGTMKPFVELEVNGTKLDPYFWENILGVAIEYVADGAAKLMIKCNGWDDVAKKYVFLDDKIFLPGNRIVVRAGWHPAVMKTMGRFWIVKNSDAGNTGTVSFNVESAYDVIHFMAENTEARVFDKDTSFKKIVDSFASDYGIKVDMDTPAPEKANLVEKYLWKKRGEQDYMFLKLVAAHIDFLTPWVEYDEEHEQDILLMKKGSLGFLESHFGPHRKFAYRQVGVDDTPLIDWSTEFSTSGLPTAIESLYKDSSLPGGVGLMSVGFKPDTAKIDVLWSGPASQEYLAEQLENGSAYTYKIMMDTTSPHGLEEYAEFKFANPEGKVPKGKHKVLRLLEKDKLPSRSDAEATARSFFQNYLDAFIFARIKVPGDFTLRPPQIHEIKGIAKARCGYYQVISATHKLFPAPYITDLILHKVVVFNAATDTVNKGVGG